MRSGPPIDSGWDTTSRVINHGAMGGLTTRNFWICIAERNQHPTTQTALDAFDLIPGRGLRNTVLKEFIEPTAKGPTCAAPKTVKEDAQWLKLDWKDAFSPMKLPSVLSPTKYVRLASQTGSWETRLTYLGKFQSRMTQSGLGSSEH
ncbi:hypothetical protein ACA910_002569 [Epithemia clementina (nom. ined.)]